MKTGFAKPHVRIIFKFEKHVYISYSYCEINFRYLLQILFNFAISYLFHAMTNIINANILNARIILKFDKDVYVSYFYCEVHFRYLL